MTVMLRPSLSVKSRFGEFEVKVLKDSNIRSSLDELFEVSGGKNNPQGTMAFDHHVTRTERASNKKGVGASIIYLGVWSTDALDKFSRQGNSNPSRITALKAEALNALASKLSSNPYNLEECFPENGQSISELILENRQFYAVI
jgi:hypothetical protein